MSFSIVRKITRKHLEMFLQSHANSGYSLDIGSGGSLYGYERFFPNRITVDIDPTRNPQVVGDIHELPFEAETFDVVLCIEVLEHCLDPRKAIAEMKRVLKPGGTLLLTTRFVYPLHDVPHDYWRFTKYGLQELIKEGWELCELRPEVGTFSTIAVLLQRIAYQTRLSANAVSKTILFMLAWVFNHMQWVLQHEYGDIKRNTADSDILASGYYVVAVKK